MFSELYKIFSQRATFRVCTFQVWTLMPHPFQNLSKLWILFKKDLCSWIWLGEFRFFFRLYAFLFVCFWYFFVFGTFFFFVFEVLFYLTLLVWFLFSRRTASPSGSLWPGSDFCRFILSMSWITSQIKHFLKVHLKHFFCFSTQGNIHKWAVVL